jgi:hypothetical protein
MPADQAAFRLVPATNISALAAIARGLLAHPDRPPTGEAWLAHEAVAAGLDEHQQGALADLLARLRAGLSLLDDSPQHWV